ncbi:hypothetical protein Lalb_Chr04g0256501 [Lupinus albus]|uniref:Uncharacterized protein n=1 Tax=Lupinus albus TaxID=3870 RepID=A0A6A4QQ27_LUPAL|nr:hypothetical protein Lalb_Chr04g0256501 [Lupinus albus]
MVMMWPGPIILHMMLRILCLNFSLMALHMEMSIHIQDLMALTCILQHLLLIMPCLHITQG